MRTHCNPHNTMTLVKHRPYTAHVSPFEGLFNGFFGQDLGPIHGNDDHFRDHPRVNIVEDKTSFRLSLLAPGFNKEDLKLNMEKDLLTISADRKQEQLDEHERYTRREFGSFSFKRSFRLPETVNAEAISAEYNNGVLTVKLPKSEPTKPTARTIDIA